jgi:arylsulfatase A-like enzyme
MMRPTILIALLTLSLPAAEPRPNVLMIAVDDLADYISILQNHSGVKTPNFDRLARSSVNFTRAYCAAPLCQPSRAAVSSGMAPHQTGIYQLSDSLQSSAPALKAVSLEEQFKRHGYDTFLTGKYYHGNPDSWWPGDRIAAMWTERKPPFSDHGPILTVGDDVMGKGVYKIGPAPGGMESMPDLAALKNTRGWLARTHEKPFFMVHGISKPHLSFVVPQRFFDLYPLDSIVLPDIPPDDFSDIPPSVRNSFLREIDVAQFKAIQQTEDGWKKVMQAYLASISFCDWVVGDLLDALEASPHAANTIIVLWSDHGYHIGEKQKLHKQALWTQTSRMPFLIHLPGMKGRNCAAPVSLLDIYPTLSELCDLNQPVPQALAGHSLVPLLRDPAHAWPHVALTSHGFHNAAVTDTRYHYIQYADGSNELYDHSNDPREYRNLAAKPELKPVVERLKTSIPNDWVPMAETKARKSKGKIKP